MQSVALSALSILCLLKKKHLYIDSTDEHFKVTESKNSGENVGGNHLEYFGPDIGGVYLLLDSEVQILEEIRGTNSQRPIFSVGYPSRSFLEEN